jgi:hypothetical protein
MALTGHIKSDENSAAVSNVCLILGYFHMSGQPKDIAAALSARCARGATDIALGSAFGISKLMQAAPAFLTAAIFARPYSCTPVCRMVIALESLTSPIGPAGDRLYVPLRITGGSVIGVGSEKKILSGDDFAVMYADEKLMHKGRFAVEDPIGDILVWYTGATLAGNGAYDELLDGQPPGVAPCRLSVVFVSTGLPWRSLTRRPLLGVGSFDGVAGRLNVPVLSVPENDARS